MTPEVVPPLVPQFNWVDLGLPSRTLWLDRPLGADAVGDPGLMYQWGSLIGYRSVSEFGFTQADYEEQGLDLITGNLTVEHDAAAAYYGGNARIPRISQFRELTDNTTLTVVGSQYRFRSNINGNVLIVQANGYFQDGVPQHARELYIWSNDYNDSYNAQCLHIYPNGEKYFGGRTRYCGLLILPVKY